jgi:hypothetical protein
MMTVVNGTLVNVILLPAPTPRSAAAPEWAPCRHPRWGRGNRAQPRHPAGFDYDERDQGLKETIRLAVECRRYPGVVLQRPSGGDGLSAVSRVTYCPAAAVTGRE